VTMRFFSLLFSAFCRLFSFFLSLIFIFFSFFSSLLLRTFSSPVTFDYKKQITNNYLHFCLLFLFC
jgi:hypothetical protein